MNDSLLFLKATEKQRTLLDTDYDDLLINEMIHQITKKKERFNIKSLFYQPCNSIEEVQYRQSILKDIYNEEVRDLLNHFSSEIFNSVYRIEHVFKRIQTEYFNNYIEKGKFLHAVVIYCQSLIKFNQRIKETSIKSSGLKQFNNYIEYYIKSASFIELKTNAETIQDKLKSISFNMLITQGNIKVRDYEDQKEISQEIQALFSKFQKSQDIKNYSDHEVIPHAEHVEVGVMDLLSKIHTELFAELDQFCLDNIHYIDDRIQQSAQEIQFYISYMDYISQLQSNFSFCFPSMTKDKNQFHLTDSFDIVLAHKQLAQHSSLVLNSFSISNDERVMIVTGPNQGGKTTFARMVGQVHYIASLGLSIPGSSAQLLLTNHIFTHFEKEEELSQDSGKLKDDLIRLKYILDRVTNNSLVIINEILASTSMEDGLFIGGKIIDKLVEQDCLCVYVTFLDELSNYHQSCVSFVSEVDIDDPSERTFKIVKKVADGKAHAHHIARKFKLSKEAIAKRLSNEN